ncbi:hypothetical protein ExPCM15_00397 [Escherichia coli]|nr:hypothetical protein ExPCM15_00397 [Escherichia coli]
MCAGFFCAVFHHLLQEGFIVAETVVTFLQFSQHTGNGISHFTFQMTIHLAFELFFQFRDALARYRRKDIQQVGNARFVLHIVANYRRLVGVSDRAFDFLHYRFRIFQQADNVIAVIVRLGHLLGRLQQRHYARARFRNKRLWHLKDIAVQRVETLGDIAAQFQVLFLVFTHRHQISLIQQDVRCHQHRIVKQTSVDVLGITRRFIFKLCHAAQFAEVGIAVQCPA